MGPGKCHRAMLEDDVWITVRVLFFREGKSKSWIARELGVDRNTVAKYVKDPEPPTYRISRPRAKPVADKWKERAREILEEDQNAPHKQHHTAKRVFERLVLEHGYTGSQRTITSIVAELREKPAQDAVIPLMFEPGKDGQVDFGESYADIAGQRVKLYGFELRHNYSRKKFVMYFPSPNMEAFLEGHVRAFEYFGGIVEKLSYDNLSAAVVKVGKGKERKLTSRFKQLMGYYAFKANFCTPGEEGAHEKGGVESGIGFSRRNWMVPVPKFSTIEELNAYILNKCTEDEKRTVDGQKETIGQAWAKEKEHLLPLPAREFDPGVRRGILIDRYQTAVLAGNHYSVPAKFVGKAVWIKSYWRHVEIGTGAEIVAVHDRNYGTDEYVLNPEHYLDTLERKPHAVPYARPLLQHTWPAGYWEFFKAMSEEFGPGQAGKDFIRILRCHVKYGAGPTSAAIAEALALGTANADFVIASVDRQRRERISPECFDLSNHPELLQYSVVIPASDIYQVFLEGGTNNEQCVA